MVSDWIGMSLIESSVNTSNTEPPKLSGFVGAFQFATPSLRPKHTIYAFINLYWFVSCGKDENKQKEAGISPFLLKYNPFPVHPLLASAPVCWFTRNLKSMFWWSWGGKKILFLSTALLRSAKEQLVSAWLFRWNRRRQPTSPLPPPSASPSTSRGLKRLKGLKIWKWVPGIFHLLRIKSWEINRRFGWKKIELKDVQFWGSSFNILGFFWHFWVFFKHFGGLISPLFSST